MSIKVGDRVRVLVNYPDGEVIVGTVMETDGDVAFYLFEVMPDAKSYKATLCFSEDELEVI